MNLSVRTFSAERPVIQHLDRVAASLMAFCPVLQHYQSPLFNAALTVMVLLVPYLVLRILSRIKEIRLAEIRPVWALIAYMVFRVVDHGTSVTELGQSVVLIVFFALGSTPGFPFIASIISIFSGVQLFTLGIIGEYLARVYDRASDRPPYVVRETAYAVKEEKLL